MKCFYCNQEIEGNDFQIIALDRPYVNIFIHKGKCIADIAGQGIINYLTENSERVYELASPASGSTKKGKKK